MATAVLEHVNKFSKYGLTRRPTYEEITNLISENEKLTGKLPNREATFYKNSPEGSFFDGLDQLEILREQQNRIQARQMRDLMMRRNLGGATYSVARLQQQRGEMDEPQLEVQRDTDMNEASIQASLQQRAQQAVERAQQTGEAHRQGFLSGTVTPIIDRIFSVTTPKTPTTPVPTLQMPTPQRPIPQLPHHRPKPIHIGSDVEEISSVEMHTGRDDMKTETEGSQSEPKQAVLRTITYRTNVGTLSEKALKFQLFIRGIDVDDPETQVETRARGSRGSGMTPKQFYQDLAQKMVQDGRWQTRVEEELLKKRIQDYRKKGQPRGSKD